MSDSDYEAILNAFHIAVTLVALALLGNCAGPTVKGWLFDPPQTQNVTKLHNLPPIRSGAYGTP